MVPRAAMGLGPARVGSGSSPYTFDAGSPDVQEYLVSIVRELVTNYEIDGIHWDYIRYTQTDAGYPADSSYANSGLARFQRITGRSDVPLATGDAQWNDFRRRTIDELITRDVVRRFRQLRRTRVSRCVIRQRSIPWGDAPADFTNSSAYGLFQNWEMWMRVGWLDAGIPMMYDREFRTSPADNQYQCTATGWTPRWAGGYDRHMFIGQGNYMNQMNDSFTQMLYAESHGADGLVSYSYCSTVDTHRGASTTTETDYNWYPFIASTIFNQAAVPPEMPWRDPLLASDGTLYGRVSDAGSGLPVDDATVQVGDLDPVQTDGNGYYVVTMVPSSGAGLPYDVTAAKAGYAAMIQRGVLVAPGNVRRQDFPIGVLTLDCNNNQIEDACEISCDAPGCSASPCGTAADCNSNGIPDECEADADADQVPDDCDQCPNTVPGAEVDGVGCPPLVRRTSTVTATLMAAIWRLSRRVRPGPGSARAMRVVRARISMPMVMLTSPISGCFSAA